MPDLIPIESINALQVFTEDGMDPFLAKIKNEVSNFEPDVATTKGRGEIKSIAYKIILSKGVIDRAGAELVKGWKAQAEIVDASRRKARDFLDDLSDEVRRPLTDYEIETAEMLAAAKQKALILTANDEALAEHEIWLGRKELAEREAKLKEAEEENERIEQKRRQVEEEHDRQEAMRKNAKAEATRVAKEKIQAANRRLKEAKRQAKEDEEKAERARVEFKKRAERETIEVAAQAKREKAEAVKTERQRVIRKQEDRTRIAEKQADEKREAEAKRQAIEEARQANTEHRREVNQGALKALVENGFQSDVARKFITAVFQEKIPGIRMVY